MRPQVPEGYVVEFVHYRNKVPPRPGKFDENPKLSSKGGETRANIYDLEGNLVVTAGAVCSPEDNYNKRIGRDIALGRALKALDMQLIPATIPANFGPED